MATNNQSNLSTEDKDAWCAEGEVYERAFVKLAPYIGVNAEINPAKETNDYAIDLIVDGRVTDLKRQKTPFFKAKSKLNGDPQHTVTFNTIDYERYKEKLPHAGSIDILFWVSWERENRYEVTVNEMDGIWRVSMPEIIHMVEQGGLEPHEYKKRTKHGRNATHSYGLDLRRMQPVIHNGYRFYTQAELNRYAGVEPGEVYCFPEFIARIESVDLPTAKRCNQLWKRPFLQHGSIREDIEISYTKHPHVLSETGNPQIGTTNVGSAKVSAVGWDRLGESLGLIQVEPQSDSPVSASN